MKVRLGYSLGTEGEKVSFKTPIYLLWLLVLFVAFLTLVLGGCGSRSRKSSLLSTVDP